MKKNIESYERYLISDTGDVFIQLIDRIKPVAFTFTNGYKYVTLSRPRDGMKRETKRMTIHRLVAKAFIPNPHNLPCVNHKNFDRGDNRVENLEWVTTRSNVQYSVDAGRKPGKKNEESNFCKYSNEQYKEMINIMLEYGPQELMIRYGLTYGAAYNMQYHYRKGDRRKELI